MAQFKVFAHSRAAQIQVTVFHPELVAPVRVVFDGEGGNLGTAQDVDFLDENLNVARRYFVVFAGTLQHFAGHLDDKFAPQAGDLFPDFFRGGFLHHQLCYPVTVAQVNESHGTEVPDFLHPTAQAYCFVCIFEPQLSASMCSVHYRNFINFRHLGEIKCLSSESAKLLRICEIIKR